MDLKEKRGGKAATNDITIIFTYMNVSVFRPFFTKFGTIGFMFSLPCLTVNLFSYTNQQVLSSIVDYVKYFSILSTLFCLYYRMYITKYIP